MSNIDERIVEMKFENHLFEKNVHTSIGTLEKLKAALKFDGADKSFDNVQKSVNAMDFSKMADGIDALNKRFSSFGIVGMTVIQDLTRAAEGMLKKVYDNTLGQIKTGGWSRATNVDQAKFLIEGLGHTWEEVSDSIDYAVKSTAYGMDEAAKAAAQFLASGVKAGDQMNYSLRAISGVAAMTNSSYSEIAHIFTTISGQGKVTAEQLNQLASRGLNAAAELAKQMNVTEEEVRKMVTKGEVSFDKFAKAMDDAYGEHAKEANKTFEGSMANMKAALSRIGEKIFAPIRKEAVPIFNALREGIDNIKNALADSGVFDKFAHFLETVSKFSVNVIGKIFGNVSWITELGKSIGGAIETLDNGIAKVGGFFKGVSEAADKASKKIESAALTIERVDELANQVIRGDFGNGEARFKALDELTGIEGSWKTIQNRVNELLDCSFRYDDAIEAVKGSTDDLRVTAEYTGKSLRDQVGFQENAKFALEDLGKAIHDSVGEAEQLSVFEWAASVIAGFKAVSSTAGNIFSSVVRGMTGPLINIGKTVATAFGNATTTMAGWFTSFGQWMLDANAYEKIQNGVNIVFTKFQDILSGVSDAGGKVFTALGGVFTKIRSGVSTGIGKVQEFFSAFTETEGFLKAKTFFSSLGDQILTVKDNIVNGIVDTFNNFANTDFKLPEIDIGSLVASASEKLSKLIDKISEVKENIVSFFTAKFSDEGSIFGKIASFFSNLDWSEVLNSLLSKLQSVGNVIGDVFGTAGDIILNVWDTIKEAFGGITESISSFKDSIDFGGFFDSILGKVGGLGDKFKSIKDTIKGLFGKDVIEESPLFNGELKGKFGGIAESFSGVSKIASKFTALFSSDKGMNKFSLVTEKVSSTMSDIATKVTPQIGESTGNIITVLIDAVGRVATSISGFVTKVVPMLITGISRAVAFVANAASTIIPIIMDIVSIAAPMLLAAIKTALDFVRGFLSVFSSLFSGSDAVKTESMASKFASGIAKVVLFLANNIFPILGDTVEGIFTALGKLIKMGANFLAADPVRAILTAFTGINIAKGISAIINIFKGFGDLASKGKKALNEWANAQKRVSKATARELNARAILEVAAAIGILAASFYALGQLDSGQFKQAIAGIVILGGVLAGLIFILGKFFGNSGTAGTPLTPLQTLQQSIADFGSKVSESLKKFGVAAIIASFAVAITAIVVAISKLGKLPIGVLLQGGIAVAAIIASLTGAIVLMNKFGSENIKTSHAAIIVAFAIAIKAIAGAITSIGSLSGTQFTQGIGGVAAIFTGLVGLTFMLSKMKDVKPGPIVAMIGLIVSIAGSLLALSFMKPARLKAAANSIMKVMLSMAVLTAAFNSLAKVKTGETEHMWKAFAVITAFFAEISAVLAVGALALPEDAVKKLPDIANALSEVMIGLGLMAAGFGIFNHFSPDADLKTDGLIVLVGAAMTAITAIAGFIVPEEDLQAFADALGRAEPAVRAIGHNLGSLFRGLVTGFLGIDPVETIQGLIDGVKNLPETLSDWIERFDGIFETLDSINSKYDEGNETGVASRGITDVVTAVAANVGATAWHIQEIKDSGAKPEDVDNHFKPWVDAIVKFANELNAESIDTDGAIAKVQNLDSLMSEFTNVVFRISGGTAADGTHYNGISSSDKLSSLGDVSKQMLKFAGNMVLYSFIIGGINSHAVQATQDAVGIITTLGGSAAIIGQDSILGQAADGSLLGEGSISYFASQLGTFAGGLVAYATEINGMVGLTGAVEGTNAAADMILTLGKRAADIGKGIDFVNGNDGILTDIGLFSTNLGDLGTAFKTYSDNITGMNPFAVILNKAACDMIMDLAKSVPDTNGGFLEFLLGNQLDTFSEKLPKLAEGFVSFSETAGGFQAEDAKKIVDTFKTLAETADLIVEYSGATGKEPIETSISTLAETISGAFDILAFEGRVDETDTAALISFGENIGKNLGTGIATGIQNSDGGAEIQSALSTLFEDLSFDSEGSDTSSAFAPIVEALTTALSDMNTVIVEQGLVMSVSMRMNFSKMATVIMGCRGMLNSAVSSACAGMSAQIQKYAQSFATKGKNLMLGLAQGIRSGGAEVLAAVGSVVSQANDKVATLTDQASPSKLWAKYGLNMDLGLAKGLSDNAGVVVDGVNSVIKGANRSINNGLESGIDSTMSGITSQLLGIYAYINSVVNDASNINPVITPVVDLSQVQNGMYSAGAMLSSTGSAFGAGALSYARSNFPGSYSYGMTGQGASNIEVVRALNGVRSDLKDLGEALSSMDMILDNGALVGQMGTGMDRQLGTIQKFKERWA